MTCVDIAVVPNQGPLVAGHAYDRITRTVELLTGVGRTQRLDFIERHASAQRTRSRKTLGLSKRRYPTSRCIFRLALPMGLPANSRT